MTQKGHGLLLFQRLWPSSNDDPPYHVVKIREQVKKDLGKTSLLIPYPSLRAPMMPETPRRSH